ncbi:MAG: GAF domain-containing protein [Chloroflexi bacterium]|nr:GAF domain-containing protein [Chloroflexota bacterium]
MPTAGKAIPVLSDSLRDAQKYHNLLLAIQSAIGRIGALEREGRAGIDEVLQSLLPDLVEALGAAHAFVALAPLDERNKKGGLMRFELTAVYPKSESNKSFLPWSKPLGRVLSEGKARVVEPFEDSSTKFIPGFEVFQAKTVVLMPMTIGERTRIIGVCNRSKPEMDPFLATDRRALESVIELIAIGLRVGERRRQELENIQKISAAINAEPDLNNLLPLIARKAAEVFSAPAASLMLWDKNEQNLVIKASFGLSPNYIKQQRIPRKRAEAAIASAGNMRTIITPDLRKRPYGNLNLVKAEQLCSTLSVQLRVSDKLIGILNIYSQNTPRTFHMDEVELAEIFANHAEAAIHNAHQRQREVDSLLATSDALEATLDEGELLDLIAGKIHGVFQTPVGLYFQDEIGGNLILRASRGLSDNFAKHSFKTHNKVFTTGKEKVTKPFVIEDLRATAHGIQDLFQDEELFNALIAPLVTSGASKTIGFLVIYGKFEPRVFTDEDKKIAGILAGQSAVAVRTTQIHGQNKMQGEQLNALDQIALDITGELDSNELLASIIQRAAGLVRARGGIIYLWNDKKGRIEPSANFGDLDLGEVSINEKRGAIYEVMRTGASFMITNYYRWSKRQTTLDKFRLTAVLGSPILSEGRLIGVIAVHDTAEGRVFSKADQYLLERFANHAAVALENSQAYASEQEAKNDLKRLIGSSLDGIIAVDTEGIITIYNEGAERICGYSSAEMLGQSVGKIYGSIEIAREINRRLFMQEKTDNWETFLLAKNGQKIPVALSATIQKDNEGNHKGSVGFFKDLRPLRATLDTIAAISQARDLDDGLNALAEGMVRSVGVTFCHVLFLEPDHKSLKVRAAYPVDRSHSVAVNWQPGIGKISNLDLAIPMRNLLQINEPVVYRKGETSKEGVLVIQHIREITRLADDLESVLLIPLASAKGNLGICALGEVRRWERNPFTEEKIRPAQSIANQAASLIERLQTYEALRLREGLLKAGKEITSLQELPKILQSITHAVREAMECDLVTLYTYSEAKDKIELPTVSGQLDYPEAPLALGYVSKKSVVWKILESREAHFAEDARQDQWMVLDEADRHPDIEPFVIRERIASSAGIPLLMGNERVGILFASFRSHHPFSDKEKSDLGLFATQAAIAINNARLVQKEEKKRKHLEAVVNASKVITASVGLQREEILEKILEQAVETIRVGGESKATLGTMQIFDDKTKELVFKCVYPPSILPELKVEIGNQMPVLPGMPGITVRAALQRTPQIVRNVANDHDYVVYSDKTKSELAVPLIDEERLIGVLDVENENVDAFDEEDVEAFRSLADMAVVALKNAENAGQLSFANTVASMGAWGAEIAHDVNRETGAIQRKIFRLQQHFTELSPDVKKILRDIETYAESLMLPPLPKRVPKPGEITEINNAANLDAAISSYIESIRSTYPDVALDHDLRCNKLHAAIHDRWLQSLLRHFIKNAIRSTEDREIKRVLVRTSVHGKFARVEIEDSGKGVRPELRPLLFQQPIPHDDEGDNRDGQGLLIVRFLAERHGGTIGLDWSQLEEGSCFYFTVPIASTGNG